MQLNLQELATRLGAKLQGDPTAVVTGVAGLDQAGPSDVSFLSNPKYAHLVATTRAAAVLVREDFQVPVSVPLLRVKDPYFCVVELLRAAALEDPLPPGVHPSAVVDRTARIHPEATIGPLVVVEAEAVVGAGTFLGAGVFVGKKAILGAGCMLHPKVVVEQGVQVGDRVIVHSGAVLGSDGFGFLPGKNGHEKIPQVGTVVVGDDVEIGSNVTVDRGTLGETRIGRGVKIDNLVHIAHNVTLGENTLLVAQVGISGSTEIGANVTIAGQAGVGGHLHVGDGAVIGARAGVTKSVPPAERVSYFPAMNHERAKRLNVYYRRLPDLFETVKKLKDRIREIEAEREKVL